MSKEKHKQETAVCGVCQKPFKRSASYMPVFRKKTCGGKCRLIEWALREANDGLIARPTMRTTSGKP